MFGVEITDTAILFLDKLVVFVASPKKISFLKQIEGGKENDSSPKFKFISREKTDANKTFLREAIEALKKSHNVKCSCNLDKNRTRLLIERFKNRARKSAGSPKTNTKETSLKTGIKPSTKLASKKPMPVSLFQTYYLLKTTLSSTLSRKLAKSLQRSTVNT